MLIVFILSILVNVGMWFERFVIVVISLHREFIPANWSYFRPTWVDITTFLGTFGLFFTFSPGCSCASFPIDSNCGSQGRDSAGRPAPSAGWRKNGRASLMAANPQTYGILAEFETPAATIHAAEKVRDAGLPQMGRCSRQNSR